MKTITILVLFMAFMGMVFTCKAQSTDQNQKVQKAVVDKVEVYYFHYERRCATCMAVEEESQKALNELYPEKMKTGEMTFLSVNIEEESNNALTEKYKVSGQTLLIVKGSKQENLTNTAFLYAKTNPDKLKKEIGEAIEKL
jgi:hypothetical protein